MPGEPKESPPKQEHQGQSKGPLLDWLDVIAKLVGAAAVLIVALIANSFQSRLTGVSIQSQREQAESQLRANMFTSLIGPITGPQKDGKPISPDREELLAELLALNFNENFELKPLLEDASKMLANKKDSIGNGPANAPDPREPLWSIARRIAQRQKASIAWEWSTSKTQPTGCEFYTVTVDSKIDVSSGGPACQLVIAFGQRVRLKSPDDSFTLQMALVHPDWKNQTVEVSALPFLTKQGNPLETDTTYRFTLSWFDLPLTDNTLLPDGNRFAIYLRLISSDPEKLTVVVVWFPKGYFTPRERPLNYAEVQQLLGREQH
jgi:hypothetical protein